ncbi:MAG TPA: hypothetical protein VKY31_07200, partial [Terriglobia bacterium]|nr:hypothetical protein [Terriglobia bacterium]
MNFSKWTDAKLSSRGRFICRSIAGRPDYFPKPVIDLDALSAKLDRFDALVAEQRFKDVRITAEKASVRREIEKDLKMLGVYVENEAVDDIEKFTASGFERNTSEFNTPQPLKIPAILGIEQRTTGVLAFTIESLGRDARSYGLRRTTVDQQADEDSWIEKTLPSVKDPILISGLTPGVVYAFQV